MSKKQDKNIAGNEAKKDKMYAYYITFNYQTPEGHIAVASDVIQASSKIEYWSDIKLLYEAMKKSHKNMNSVMLLNWVLLKGMDRNKKSEKKVKSTTKKDLPKK